LIRPYQIREFARRVKKLGFGLLKGDVRRGYCPICQRRRLFIKTGPWLRDELLCDGCHSIPRFRAIIAVLEEVVPGWRGLRIHESSPGSASSDKIARECPGYVPTQYWPEVEPGQAGPTGVRCENLERQTFADVSFELVVTQDVFEHVLDPAAGFREIARTLVPGGMHVFTIPWYWPKPTLVRAIAEGGTVRHLCPPDYHRNPVDEKGSLVVTEWGIGLPGFILEHSGMSTVAIRIFDPRQGIEGEFREVFVSVKP
jgi:SAM-dependent methyltransferase